MPQLTIEQRLDRMESRAQIEDLCAAYCIACDDRDMARLSGLFTPDVRIFAPNGSMDARGRDAVMAMYDELFAVRGPGFHWSHDRMIAIDAADPDLATGTILAHAETSPAGQVSIAGIRYTDRYRRDDGIWRFAERVLDFVYYLPLTEYIARFRDRDRVRTASGWNAAEFPEGSPGWATWQAANAAG